MTNPFILESDTSGREESSLSETGISYTEPSAYVKLSMETLSEKAPEILEQYRAITRKEILEISIGKTLAGTDTPITFDIGLSILEICEFYKEISSLLERVEEKGAPSFLEEPTCIYLSANFRLIEESYYKKSPHVKDSDPSPFIPPFEILFRNLIKGKDGRLTKGTATLDLMNNLSLYTFLELSKALTSRDRLESFLEHTGIKGFEELKALHRSKDLPVQELCEAILEITEKANSFEDKEETLPYRNFLTLFTSLDLGDSHIGDYYFCSKGLNELLVRETKEGSKIYSFVDRHAYHLLSSICRVSQEIACFSGMAKECLELSEKKKGRVSKDTFSTEDKERLENLEPDIMLSVYLDGVIDRAVGNFKDYLEGAEKIGLAEE